MRRIALVLAVLALILGACVPPNDDGYVVPEPPFGVGFVEPGDANLLYIGSILTPTGIVTGEMLVDATGHILYIGEDSSSHPEAAGATRLVCAHGLAVPGLIDAWRHMAYAGGSPVDTDGERYNHRHQWRLGLGGHTEIPFTSTNRPRYDEAGMILSGTTSAAGPILGTLTGMVRNLRSPSDTIGLFTGSESVDVNTFPLDDSSGFMTTDPTAYDDYPPDPDSQLCTASAVIAAEGITAEARCEFLAMTGSGPAGTDILSPKTALVHGVALLPQDVQRMAAAGSTLVWTPRSDLHLYGNTAPVTIADRMGCNIALGSTWTITGSPNLLEELKTARFFNQNYLDGYFSDEELFAMATLNSARAYHVDDRIGTLEVGKIADFAVFDTRAHAGLASVFAAELADVAAVFVGGTVLCGDTYLVDPIRGLVTGSETLAVGSTTKRIFAQEQFGATIAEITVAGDFPLVYASVDIETEIVPSRPSEYTGVASALDLDGDGIGNSLDNAPSVFNPPRPVDGGVQGDQDGDGIGDVIDTTPLPP